jgi:hypothetical protein
LTSSKFIIFIIKTNLYFDLIKQMNGLPNCQKSKAYWEESWRNCIDPTNPLWIRDPDYAIYNGNVPLAIRQSKCCERIGCRNPQSLKDSTGKHLPCKPYHPPPEPHFGVSRESDNKYYDDPYRHLMGII